MYTPTSTYMILALFLVFFLPVFNLDLNYHSVEVQAESPSFVRQEIFDDLHNDWLLWRGSYSSPKAANITTHSGMVSEVDTAQDISECKTFGGNNSYFSPDIESVSYISDGNTLNATVWLTDPFEEPPLTDKLDTFQENLVLRITQTNLTLEDYTNVKRGQVIDPLVQSAVEENYTSLSGSPAHEIVYGSNTGSNKLKIMQAWTIKNGNAYEFTYSALDDKYLEFLSIIRQMIDSFTISDITVKDGNIKGLSLTNSNQSNNQPEGFSIYERNGIILDYPKDWVVIDENQNPEEGMMVVFRSPFEDEILNEPSWREITYTMAVDIDSVHDAGTDYRIKILRAQDEDLKWNWSRQVQEVSAYDKIRILHEDMDYTSFSRNGEPFILFTFDLNSVNAPSQYKAVFYITDYYIVNHHLCRLIDTTNWVIIPPPDFDISVEPSSAIVLRPNEEKTVQLQIKGDSDLQSEAALMTTTTRADDNIFSSNNINTTESENKLFYGNEDIGLEFTPNVIPVPPSGVGASTLYIKVAENATAKSHTFPILANISFPTSIINRGGEIFNNSRSVNLMESTNLTLAVLPPYTFEEKMSNFVTAWITPISGVWSFVAGVGAVVAPLLLYFYKRKK